MATIGSSTSSAACGPTVATVNRAAAGGTYPDLFAAAAEAARHRWVRSDFEEATARYYAAEKPADILLGLRRRQASRNLRLVCDALAVAVRTQQPASPIVANS